MTAAITIPVPTDAAAIARVGRTAFAEAFAHLFPAETLSRYLDRTWSEAKVSASLAKPGNRYLVARRHGEVVGLIKAKLDCPLPEGPAGAWHQLQKMYVLPAFQGQGIGSTLVTALLEDICAAGPAWWLQVHLGNLGAQRLYLRFGFREHHRGQVVLEGVPIDFLILVRG